MSSQPLHVEHRARYLPDYSMLIGCKCGVKFEPSDNDDAYAEHLASLEKPVPTKRQQSQYLPRRKARPPWGERPVNISLDPIVGQGGGV